MAFELPPLPYDYNALEPYIDTLTMQIHHDRHHGAYVTNLNNAVQGTAVADWSLESLVSRINEVPENIRTAVRNNGGGHINHSMFWQIMGPNAGGSPSGELSEAIKQHFGSFDQFKATFKDAGA
ncbi:MAG: superoxide dismutase, partial [Ktedonobacteraceae bacterium]